MLDFNNLNFDEDFKQDLAPTMIRQRYKSQLLSITNGQLEDLSKSRVVWGRKYKKAHKDFLKDYFKGIKEINKKNPVYIEMPSLKEVGKGKGQYKKVADKRANDIVKSKIDENNINIDCPDVPGLPPT